ncbi:Neuronal acetylcholine receptor subunit alpha-10 [Trichinella pseudospiralis]|uniref:Neuronal acetylcholine receptor subunit alpha-10 n=1 Tax=Trichinella pseudospiralis TaxID=6337 RepID=A0A0V1FDZ9_TRIPS|nr:Neuronal acetylcholine receptor subunit alpha-10 [Trichinella pseudospiralis]
MRQSSSSRIHLMAWTLFSVLMCNIVLLAHPVLAVEETPFMSNLFQAYQQVCEPLKDASTANKTSPQSYIFCLPLIVGLVTENNAWMTELYKGTLAMELPPSATSGRTAVHILSAAVEQFSISEANNVISDLELVVRLSWIDSRLRWDIKTWPFETFPAKLNVHHQLWGPVFVPKERKEFFLTYTKISYNDAVVRSNGNVTTTVSIRVPRARCTNDLHQYPYDRQHCCFDIRAEPWKRLRTVVTVPTATGSASSPSSWALENVKMTPESSLENEREEYIRTCVTVVRNSAAIQAELSLPMAVSAVIFLCAQLTGKWKTQVYLKIVAIFLQLFAFQALISNTNLSFASQTPVVYRYYNFTVGMTVFSLLQTLVLWALSRRTFDSPPPHRFIILSDAMNYFVYGKSNDKMKECGQAIIEKAKTSEWHSVVLALHSALSILMVFIYLLGVALIYS